MIRIAVLLTLLLLLLLLGSLFSLAPATVELVRPSIVISSGSEDGNYYQIASRIQAKLSAQHQKFAEVVLSQGSLENLVRLDDPESPVAVAMAQADAVEGYVADNPSFADEFLVLADLGNECVFLLTHRGSGISSFADLKSGAKHKVAVGKAQSGAAVTYANMRRLEPGLRDSKPAHVDGMEAMLALAKRSIDPQLGSVMLVQRPRILSAPLQLALENPKEYAVVQIRPGELRSTSLPDGSPVYTYEKVTLRGSTIDTICTRGLLLAAKGKIDEEMKSALASLLLESLDQIAPGTR